MARILVVDDDFTNRQVLSTISDLFEYFSKFSRKFPGFLHKLFSFFRDATAGFNQFFSLFGFVRHFI